MKLPFTLASVLLVVACAAPQAQTPPPEPNSAASKLMLRGKPYGVKVVDMRAQKRNDVLVVQTELVNTENGDRQVYWRYRWLDASGMQVGDGDAWKPLLMYGQQSQFVRGTAPTGQVVDFRLEMNTEKL
ncbi:MAG: YcfL family protein [Pseudomonadota bacterium]